MTKTTKPQRAPAPATTTKESILHLRLERADHDALEALVLSTGLDRSALTRLVLRAGLRVAENDPRDLLAPQRVRTNPGRGTQASQASYATGARTVGATTRSGGGDDDGELAETGGVMHAPHTATDDQRGVATPVANDASKPRTKPTKG